MHKFCIMLPIFIGLMLPNVASAKQIYQCNIQGSVVFQYNPCPENRKTYEDMNKVNQFNEIEEAKKAAALQLEQEYQERLKQTAAQKGKIAVKVKHQNVEIQKLRPTTKAMAFDACKSYLRDAQLSAGKKFKSSVISSTNTEHLVRICREKGSIILACSEPNKQLVISESAHCPLK